MSDETVILGWQCVLCGDWHPIDHEGLINADTGEVCCCHCEGKLRLYSRPTRKLRTIVGVLHPGGGPRQVGG